jgi:hypothetical protein
MKRIIISAIIILLIFIPGAYPYTLILTETARGEYENGKFISKKSLGVKYHLDIDETTGKALVNEYKPTSDGLSLVGHLETQYSITYGDDGTVANAATPFIDKKKANQKMIYLIGSYKITSDFIVTEMFIIGESFFEEVAASDGRFRMTSGTVEKEFPPATISPQSEDEEEKENQ